MLTLSSTIYIYHVLRLLDQLIYVLPSLHFNNIKCSKGHLISAFYYVRGIKVLIVLDVFLRN